MSLIPGKHRINLHAIYAESAGRRVDRDEVRPEHFAGWIDWARETGLGMDFNPTFFSHPLAADGLTLAHPDAGIRRFWIEHGRACRRIGAAAGPSAGIRVRDERVDPGRLQGPAGRQEGAPRALWPSRSTKSSPSRWIPLAT